MKDYEFIFCSLSIESIYIKKKEYFYYYHKCKKWHLNRYCKKKRKP